MLRTAAARVRGQDLLTNGASLIAQLLEIALAEGIPVWTEAPVDELVVEDGRVVGVRTVRDGTPVMVRARQGVLLSAGGFAHNAEMRERFGGDQPNSARWSIANPGDTGEALEAAMGLGAQTALMDEAWWLPSPRTGRFGQSTLDQARQRPRTIYVDAAGQRFVNESNSYMEVGKAMYERDKTSRAVPCWLVFDDRYRKRYAHLRSRPGRFPRQVFESGRLKQAWTLDDLARLCGIDAEGLRATVERFNEHAAQRRRPRLRPRASAYNRALGDPNPRVHPCLGPIDEAPYYAVEVVPGDIGTCGGLVTDEHARVVDEDDQPIDGLYATGNITATVMGRHYLGPGASIANSMVFGYVAARHAAERLVMTGSGQLLAVPVDGDRLRRALLGGEDDVVLRRRRRVDDERHLVVVEVEGARRGEGAVPRAHAPVTVDLDVQGHGIDRRTPRPRRETGRDRLRRRQVLQRP